MLKVKPHPDYPPEEGRFLRGNDYSPVAVAIILSTEADKIPPDLVALVRAGVESGAAIRTYTLHDPGAYPDPPLSGRITWRVTQPWAEPADGREGKALERVRQMIETLRAKGRQR